MRTNKRETIILASASPRRVQLLKLLGVPFTTDASDVDEQFDPLVAPEGQACQLALAKARAVARRHPKCTILAADTLGVLQGHLLGKPQNPEDAVAILRALRGTWHEVITGVAVINGTSGQEYVAAEVTRVLMRPYSDEEIAAYVASGDPMDKAAAYAIQNRSFRPVERVDVCYTNVMGLPLCTTYELLIRASIAVPGSSELLRTDACPYCQRARAS